MAEATQRTQFGAILIVEHEETLREFMAVVLESEGFRVLEADDGLSALAHLSADTPVAIIVLDLQLPRAAGWKFRKRQLANPNWAAIPTFVLTGASLSVEEMRWLRATAVLTKPFQFEELLTFGRA